MVNTAEPQYNPKPSKLTTYYGFNKMVDILQPFASCYLCFLRQRIGVFLISVTHTTT